MKSIILLALVLSGCSSLSEYRRGCQDGIAQLGVTGKDFNREDFCKLVEKEDQAKKKAAKEAKEAKK
jgi:PBP1b-binding outer membrane lipoprotein LpoB